MKEQEGIFRIRFGEYSYAINSNAGAKVSSFSFSGREIIYLDQTEYLWGSTFWPSPQSEWRWPPSPELDLGPYESTITDTSIILRSNQDIKTGLVFEKTVYVSDKGQTLTHRYRMINESGRAKYHAPWEVTRVACGGMTFFPKGDGEFWGPLTPYFEVLDGVVFYQYDSSHSGRKKFNGDGSEGWLAHVTDNRLLFIKQFEDVSLDHQAPGEAEIELWLTEDHSHIELENQGEYVEIADGGSTEYEVKWYLCLLPDHILVKAGSKELVQFVRDLLGIVNH